MRSEGVHVSRDAHRLRGERSTRTRGGRMIAKSERFAGTHCASARRPKARKSNMRIRRNLAGVWCIQAGAFLFTCAFTCACSSGGSGPESAGPPSDSPPSSASSPDSPPSSTESPDGAPWCPDLLVDAGFTSLADLPTAPFCGRSPSGLVQSTLTCQGFTRVVAGEGIDTAAWWLFDSAGSVI